MSGGTTGSGGEGAEGGSPPRPVAQAPRLLSHRADPAPLPPPVREAEEISSLHVKFARLVSAAQGEPPDAPGTAGSGAGGSAGGVRAKVRARVAAVARADAGADREFTGNLVRAVAALAERLDEVTSRMGDLELLVQEVVDRLSEDLARVQVALGALDDDHGRS